MGQPIVRERRISDQDSVLIGQTMRQFDSHLAKGVQELTEGIVYTMIRHLQWLAQKLGVNHQEVRVRLAQLEPLAEKYFEGKLKI